VKLLSSLCAAVLCSVLLLSCLPIHGEEKIYDNIIRLHVLAASDSEADQSAKLQVRDAVLSFLEDGMGRAGSYAEARRTLDSLLPEIKKAAEAAADGRYSVSVLLDTESYPVRYYERFALPAGEYTSLRIVLDAGEGQNWWCVLFPDLCTARACEDDFYEDFIAAGFSSEQYKLIRRESGVHYKIRFKILEILSEFVGLEY